MNCRGKTSYRTYAEASQKAKRSSRRHEAAICPYHCRECGKYHFGNRPLEAPKPYRRERRPIFEELA